MSVSWQDALGEPKNRLDTSLRVSRARGVDPSVEPPYDRIRRALLVSFSDHLVGMALAVAGCVAVGVCVCCAAIMRSMTCRRA